MMAFDMFFSSFHISQQIVPLRLGRPFDSTVNRFFVSIFGVDNPVKSLFSSCVWPISFNKTLLGSLPLNLPPTYH